MPQQGVDREVLSMSGCGFAVVNARGPSVLEQYTSWKRNGARDRDLVR